MQSPLQQILTLPRTQSTWVFTRVRANALVAALIAAIGVLYLATIRTGHVWGDDFALYIHHAKNIVEGKAYADTGYIYNPDFPALSPRTYPPVFPLLLVPIYALFGMNFTAMKVEVILFFIATLGMIYLSFKHALTTPYSLAMLALIGLNPYIWDFKDNIVSEMPFLFFVYGSLYLIRRAYRSSETGQIANRYVVAVGSMIYLAYGTRSLGALLLPCLICYDLLRFKRPSMFVVKVTALVIACVAVQKLFVQGEGSYFDQLINDPGVIIRNFEDYRFAYTQFWYDPYPWIIRTPAFLLFSLLAAFGYVMRVRRGITVAEMLPLPYMAIILVWPSYQGNRFLLPMVPLFVFYAMVGIRSLALIRLARLQPYALGLLLVVTFVSYALQARELDYPTLTKGIGTPEAQELFAYIQTSTKPDDVLIIQKPRIVSLLTDRPGAAYHVTDDDADLWNFMRSINAQYVISSKKVFFRDVDFFHGFIERNSAQLQQVFANNEFTIYRIKP